MTCPVANFFVRRRNNQPAICITFAQTLNHLPMSHIPASSGSAARWMALALPAALSLPTVARCADALPNPPLPASPKSQPNIVLIISDDSRYLDLGCYGSENAITPNIDRLASEGLRFNRFYQAVSMSSPTRHCLYTGLYPVRSGAYPNHTYVYDGTRSVAHYLQDLGYRVALQGKRHINPVASFPFEYLGKEGQNPSKELIGNFLKESAESKQPFCLFVCSHDSHSPWNRGNPDLFLADTLHLPDNFVDTPQTRDAYRRYLAEINQLDSDIGMIDKLVAKHGLRDNTIFIYTSEQGYSFPFAKWTCYDAGLHTAFLVRWPGVIEPGSTTDALCEYVDVVPTLVTLAGGKPAKGLDGKSFDQVLLGKTDQHKEYVYALQTSRGIIRGPKCYGIRTVSDGRFRYIRNLSPEIKFQCAATGKADSGQDANAFDSWREKAATDDQARFLVDRYEYRPAEEYYDLQNDPFEMHNLIQAPEHQERIAQMRKKLDAWMQDQGDQGQATEMKAMERLWANRDKEKYQ